jgi:hypothetical protein
VALARFFVLTPQPPGIQLHSPTSALAPPTAPPQPYLSSHNRSLNVTATTAFVLPTNQPHSIPDGRIPPTTNRLPRRPEPSGATSDE